MLLSIPRIILWNNGCHRVRSGRRAAASTCLRRLADQERTTAKEAGRRISINTKLMNKKQNKLSVQDLLELEAAQRPESSSPEQFPLLSEAVQEEMAEREMKRIFDALNDRTSAILRDLGVHLTQASASWHPLNDFNGLGERLSHVEIVPAIVLTPSTGDK